MEVKASNSDLYLPENRVRETKKILDKDAFLLIMIEQLKHQDPSSPLDSDKFISQMAQFTTLEQMTNLNTQFKEMHELQQFNYGSSLIGYQVSINDQGEIVNGIVDKVLYAGKSVRLMVNGTAYNLNQVTAVELPEFPVIPEGQKQSEIDQQQEEGGGSGEQSEGTK